MKYVLDASVALKWVLPEEDSDVADKLREEFRQGIHDFLSPDVFWAEVGHALARAERRGIIRQPDGSRLLAEILTTPPRLATSFPLLTNAFSIASALRTSFYDCLYVALAERELCPFVTADVRAVDVLQAQHPCVIPLSSLA
jgi:predicted nucleic acid-binding protein